MLKALQFVVLIIICLPRSLFAQTWESLSDIPEKLTFPVTAVVDGKIHIPVSYTHLRAHETILDLVCRLLLEKKKKNTICR